MTTTHPFLKTRLEITGWLDAMQITHYTLRPDEDTYGFIVDVKTPVHLSHKKLTHMPVQFGVAKSHFLCDHNSLTSLMGCPQRVEGVFNCDNNRLTSLAYAPQYADSFGCADNQLTSLIGAPAAVRNFWCEGNLLTSLEGAPQTVSKNFHCQNNRLTNLLFSPINVTNFYSRQNCLTSLLGCPQHVTSEFDCSYNDLSSLEFCPQSVGEIFLCFNNPQLGELQNVTDFQEILKHHLIEVEKKLLNESVQLTNRTQMNHHKI